MTETKIKNKKDEIKAIVKEKKFEIKEAMETNIIYRRKIRYFYDFKSKNSRGYQQVSDNFEWVHPDTKELFHLKEPALWDDGMPVYYVIRGLNFSIGLVSLQETLEKYEIKALKPDAHDNFDLVEKGYSPDDMEAVLTSQTMNRMFRLNRKLDTNMIFSIIMLVIASNLIQGIIWLITMFGR